MKFLNEFYLNVTGLYASQWRDVLAGTCVLLIGAGFDFGTPILFFMAIFVALSPIVITIAMYVLMFVMSFYDFKKK
jgi:hypothetical protein